MCKEVQTNLSTLLTPGIKLFSKLIHEDDLHEVTSFFTDNTFAFDDTPVYVDHLIQTCESGNLLIDSFTASCSEYGFKSLNEVNIYTETVLSKKVSINADLQVSETYTQTILQNVFNSSV